jgi:hypothetical protein
LLICGLFFSPTSFQIRLFSVKKVFSDPIARRCQLRCALRWSRVAGQRLSFLVSLLPWASLLLFPRVGIAAAVPARGHRCQRLSSAAKDPIGKSKQKREKKK